MKKYLLILLIFTLSWSLFACKKTEPVETFVPKGNDFTYYQATKGDVANTLYVFGNDHVYSFSEKVLGQAIQGLFARDTVSFYYLERNSTNYKTWLTDLETTYNIKTEEILLTEMIQKYKEKTSEPGYILYDPTKLETVNVASSLCGVLGYLPVDTALENLLIESGISLKLDVRDKTERWCFDNYSSFFNNGGLVQLRGNIAHLRDYGIACKYFFFYQDGISSSSLKLRQDLHSFAVVDAPIFGWGPGTEDSHVGIASQFGQFTIPSDYCYNTSVFACKDLFNIQTVTQKNTNEAITPTDGKHYVSFIRSDGDNIQTWYNNFPFSASDMGATRGDFPMGWSIQPSLIDLSPNILDYVYRNADKNDYFVCAVSGHGYMYPKTYKALEAFASSLSMYLRKTDLEVVQILDSSPNKTVIETYSKIPELTGAIYMYGEKYAGGKGSIYWSSNGKPFVSFRESLWDTTAADVASRINSYQRDYTSIEGYTLVNLHPWSMSYQDVIELVALLNDDVVVLSPENFIKMISENVPHIDVEIK